MDFHLCRYREQDWDRVRDFIKRNWHEGHPFCNRSLFDWQFKGFGHQGKEARSLLLYHNDDLIGFRGIIPGLYQVPSGDASMSILPGGSLAMWAIGSDYRGKRLGLMMHQEVQNSLPVITGAGSEPKTSVPIYLKNGFSFLEAMHRYVIPLDAGGYHGLLFMESDIRDIREWTAKTADTGPVIAPGATDIAALASLWEERTFEARIFSLFRNTDFWKWRYADSPGFRYLFFGHPDDEGVLIARTERIDASDGHPLNGEKVFRIIEMVPKNIRAWRYEPDEGLAHLIRGTLNWAKTQGCLAADFYCSSARFEPSLKMAGFGEQTLNDCLPSCSLALLFQPLRHRVRPINALFRINQPKEGLVPIHFDDAYMVKSENDMDRPNILDHNAWT